MARQFIPRQQLTTPLQDFMKELPAILLRYALDRASTGRSHELTKERMKYSMELDTIRDFTRDIMADKKATRKSIQVEKDKLDQSMAALKVHTAITPKLDKYEKTDAGSAELPDYIMDSVLLTDERKALLSSQYTDLNELEAQEAFYKKQTNELLAIDIALTKLEKEAEKGDIDPALAGTGMSAYITDEYDYLAHWEKNYEEIWKDSPYKDLMKDVFMQKVPTSVKQQAQVAGYIDQMHQMEKLNESRFLDVASPALAQMKQTAQDHLVSITEQTTNLNSGEFDYLRDLVKDSNDFIKTSETANEYITTQLHRFSQYTDAFSFWNDINSSPELKAIATHFLPVTYREMGKAAGKHSGEFGLLGDILKKERGKFRESQGYIDDTDSNMIQDIENIFLKMK